MANLNGPTASEIGQAGAHARNRAKKRAGSGRISAQDWAPEVWAFVENGWTNAKIAQALQITPRRVSQIKSETSADGMTRVEVKPDPVAYAGMADEFKAMLPLTAEAFKLFYEYVFAPYTLPEHAESWVKDFVENRNLMLNVPPDHLKSSIFSEAVPVWLLARNRNEQIILISQTKDGAQHSARAVAHTLENNERLIAAFGRFKPENAGDTTWKPASGELVVLGRSASVESGQLSFQSRGMGQQILGMRATVVIVDDITNDEIAQSEPATIKQLRYLQKQVFTRINVYDEDGEMASGRAVIIGQRVDYADIYGIIQKWVHEQGNRKGETLWHQIIYPAVLRWPDEDPANPEPLVLWPEKRPFNELMVQYERVGGHSTFECMYQQQPLPPGERVFDPSSWEACRDYDRPGYAGVREAHTDTLFPISRVLSVDPSPDSWNGLVVADVLYDYERFVCSIIEMKSFLAHGAELEKEILRAVQQYQPDYFIFEESATSKYLVYSPFMESLRRAVTYIRHTTSRNKNDPIRGVEGLAGDFEFRRIRFPYGDAAGREMSQLLEREAGEWPVGKRADVLMALWFIRWNWQSLVPMRALSGTFDGATGRTWSFVNQEQRIRQEMLGR
jgi:hypothetical protein